MYEGMFESFDTIYFGGGTPSILSPRELETIITALRNAFAITPDFEMTIETNPCDLTSGYAESLRSLGFNRLSLGVQSFDNALLSFLGRRHTSRVAEDAIINAEKAGFENVGLDFIYGVPSQSIISWKETLSKALSYSPSHISCYQLTIEDATPLGLLREKGLLHTIGDSLEYGFFMATSRTLHDAGYIHYEVSNFAKHPLLRSRHNEKYWNHTPYLGLGPSAHSFLQGRRWWNHRSLDNYMKDILAQKKPVEDDETLTTEELETEALFLGLRTSRGIELKESCGFYKDDSSNSLSAVLKKLIDAGLITFESGIVAPTIKGLAVGDSLALSFLHSM